MNVGMSFYPQAVVLEGKVYVDGGSAVNKAHDALCSQWANSPYVKNSGSARVATFQCVIN